MKIFAIWAVFLIGVPGHAACTLALTVNGAIAASTSDYFQRAQKRALAEHCESVFVRLNTPGGDLESTRLIVEQILSSPIPYLCLITPEGAHAGSAGAILMQACHVNGGLEATNLGAATPIMGNGARISEDLRRKIINDTVSWLSEITAKRNRNADFSKRIVTEAQSWGSREAVQKKALDILAANEADFLQQARGREVSLSEGRKVQVQVGDLREDAPDLRYRILSFVADPEFAYLLFMASLGLLYIEMTHPGLIAPGVLGGLGLVLSLVALHKLDVSWGGVALIFLGLGFLVAELFFTSYGVLGIGGAAAIFIGSSFLFDPISGHALPYGVIAPVVLVLGGFFLGVGTLALRTLRLKKSDHDADLREHPGRVVRVEGGGHEGQIEIRGEFWRFRAEEALRVGDQVRVLDREGLTLKVQKEI